MGIYLPNIEMPQEGQMLVIFPDGTGYASFNVRRERIAQTKAVPVPPHGRLIDADALADQMAERRSYVGRLSDPLCLIEDAPTIIAAEEDEK